jgi:hypothetical protein
MTSPEEATSTADDTAKPRFFTAPPEFVLLKAGDLTAFLPDGAWVGNAAQKERMITVPAAEILDTNYPRIRFSRLLSLLPGSIKSDEEAPEWIALPADRVALAYKPESRPESSTGQTVSPAPAPIPAPAPAATPIENEAPPVPAWKRLPKPVLAPTPEKPAGVKTGDASPKSLEATEIAADVEPRLKELFGSDATLSIPRLIERCAALPNVKGCLLNSGSENLKAGDIFPELKGRDSIGSALSAVRKFGEISGVKFRQVLTGHTDAGPITFLRHRTLILAVAHSEGGLIPETRSKLKTTLQAIDRAVAPQS